MREAFLPCTDDRPQEEAATMKPADRGQLPTWWRTRDTIHSEVCRRSGIRRSERTMRRAAFVVDHGSPDLIKAMDSGAVSIAAAFELTGMPLEIQLACIRDPKVRRAVVRVCRQERQP